MTKQAYEELIAGIDELGTAIVHKEYALRMFRTLLLTWIPAGLMCEIWGFPTPLVSFFGGLYLLAKLVNWVDARSTRIGLWKMSRDRNPSLEAQTNNCT